MAAVTIHSHFGAQENKICHCFHLFPLYLPLSDGTGCNECVVMSPTVNKESQRQTNAQILTKLKELLVANP